MATTRKRTRSETPSKPPATIPAASPVLKSSVPVTIRFPLLIILSMTLSALMYFAISPFTRGDLATVSRTRNEWWEIAGVLGWKAALLAVGWFGGYDSTDVAALIFLSHVPYYYFLTSFYQIQPTTSLASLTVDTLAAYLPFYFLKVSSSIHNIKTPKGIAANRSVINDFPIQTITSFLAACIYGVVVLASYSTWLPTYLVTHFDGIRDISVIHNTHFLSLASIFLPVGFAAKIFLFTPTSATKPDRKDKHDAAFNAETASLGETILFNLWGYSSRSRALIKRTATLVAISVLHTYVQVYVSVEGAEGFGAAGWSSVWGLAALLTGAMYGWVEDVEGMNV